MHRSPWRLGGLSSRYAKIDGPVCDEEGRGPGMFLGADSLQCRRATRRARIQTPPAAGLSSNFA